MVERRPLTEEEKVIFQKVIRNNSEIIRRSEIKKRAIDLALSEELYLTYIQQRESLENKNRELVKTIMEAQLEINNAKGFLALGVPVEEKSTEEKKNGEDNHG